MAGTALTAQQSPGRATARELSWGGHLAPHNSVPHRSRRSSVVASRRRWHMHDPNRLHIHPGRRRSPSPVIQMENMAGTPPPPPRYFRPLAAPCLGWLTHKKLILSSRWMLNFSSEEISSQDRMGMGPAARCLHCNVHDKKVMGALSPPPISLPPTPPEAPPESLTSETMTELYFGLSGNPRARAHPPHGRARGRRVIRHSPC